MKVAVVGAGWAGLAAAVAAAEAGHRVTVLEASRALGGRARALPCTLPDGSSTVLDNGQHIMIGAYSETLSLMRRVGVDPQQVLLRLPLTLLFADGAGVRLPDWPAPLDALAGIAAARGWSLRDKASLMWLATCWRLARFRCAADVTVTALCAALSPRVMRELIEPLSVAALNTPADQASAEVFLRVMQDAVFGASGSSNLLLPRVDLSTLFPQAAAAWVIRHGGEVRPGTRSRELAFDGNRWCVDGQIYDLVLLACAASDTLGLLEGCLPSAAAPVAQAVSHWCAITRALRHEAICTVYAWGQAATLAHPMLALRCEAGAPGDGPAQFVFDRGQLGGAHGLLAFVVSASHGERDDLQTRVLAQARAQLGLDLTPVQTVVEKRATFACTPALQRPGILIAPGLLACGDYVDGPYPATLEGAVRCGLAAIRSSASAS